MDRFPCHRVEWERGIPSLSPAAPPLLQRSSRSFRRDSFGDTVIPVERVLERVVAPWAKDRVLLILMDGMSIAVWRELSQELVQAGAQLWSWREGQPLPPGLSALPSMTGFSRASLLCGKLASGGQEVERRGFAENPALMGASRSGYPPVLFHKDELAGESTRKEIRNPHHCVAHEEGVSMRHLVSTQNAMTARAWPAGLVLVRAQTGAAGRTLKPFTAEGALVDIRWPGTARTARVPRGRGNAGAVGGGRHGDRTSWRQFDHLARRERALGCLGSP
jgi:hypothetical protein